MASDHTPGPWRYDPETEEIITAGGDVIGRMEPASGPLAARAPALLIELERLEQVVARLENFDPQLVESVRDALEKA